MRPRFGPRDAFHAAVAAAAPRRWFLRGGPVGCRSVCLTFDDGPHPEHTPRLLDALREHRAVATFFVVGREARRYPDLVRRIAAEGHELGGHTFSHAAAESVSVRRLLGEVRRTGKLLAAILGRETRLFRPPYGRLSPAKLGRLWLEGQSVVLWNADPKDLATASPEALRAWFRARPLRSGDLVLLHDTHPHAAAVVPDLAASAAARGLAFATVSAWL
jgi:peptidoglycan/xylan/chitin deacetylase (PgdA/CDA1 family)